jgi:hypothetical protein
MYVSPVAVTIDIIQVLENHVQGLNIENQGRGMIL